MCHNLILQTEQNQGKTRQEHLVLDIEHEAFQIIFQVEDSTEMQSPCIERRIAKLSTYLLNSTGATWRFARWNHCTLTFCFYGDMIWLPLKKNSPCPHLNTFYLEEVKPEKQAVFSPRWSVKKSWLPHNPQLHCLEGPCPMSSTCKMSS